MKGSKKIFMLIMLSIIMLTGCSSKNEDNPMLVLCDKVDKIVNDYKSSTIDSQKYIDSVRDLKNDCTTDDYLCVHIKGFDRLNNNDKKEILDAFADELDRGCQLVREKY